MSKSKSSKAKPKGSTRFAPTGLFGGNMALTKIQLDLMAAGGCETPGCKHEDHGTIYLHGRCHLRARTEASYAIGTGILRVACAECHKLIAEIKVAE